MYVYSKQSKAFITKTHWSKSNRPYCTSSIFYEINISRMAILVNIHDFNFINLLASRLFQV